MINYQCWICPQCHDDHKFEGPCTPPVSGMFMPHENDKSYIAQQYFERINELTRLREENARLKSINLELSGEHKEGDRCPACGTVFEKGTFESVGLHMQKAQAVVDAARELGVPQFIHRYDCDDPCSCGVTKLCLALKSYDDRGDG